MKLYEEFNVAETAKRIGCSHAAVYKLINSGELKAQNCGWGRTKPRWLVREDDLRNYMDRKYPR